MADMCKAVKKNGEPCKAPATKTGFCYIHSNPANAASIGREGGRRNRHLADEILDPLPAIDTLQGVQQCIHQLVRDMYANKLHPKKAAAIATLLNTMIRTYGWSEIEKKMEELAEEVALLKKGPGPASA